ncbi:hypothetical protein HII31_06805 [Pseudocercospora fuligena]|uniref:Uncharacterized protein n=1 Tax=Pseudocercospora fuligena TaxID=685502 RepID=A0A8H6RH66_9PEZI|nr:hypothetical protein HII31_06805 [Pseudocercospora fuligena]
MAGLPKAIVKAAHTSINYPKLTTPSYESYLNTVAKLKGGNKVALSAIGKSAFDREYAAKLQQQYGHDEKLVRKHLEQTNTKAAKELWERVTRRRNEALKIPSMLADGVEHLKLPSLGSHIKNAAGAGRKNDRWSRQTYQDFARKCEKDNAQVVFTKQMMDDALRRAAFLITRGGQKTFVDSADVEKMLARESVSCRAFHKTCLIISSALEKNLIITGEIVSEAERQKQTQRLNTTCCEPDHDGDGGWSRKVTKDPKTIHPHERNAETPRRKSATHFPLEQFYYCDQW